MKFIIDAQLPLALNNWLLAKDLDSIHTREFPRENLTDDFEIIQRSVREKRIVISKDSDFLKYYILHGEPYKLLMITTGNIVNKDLISLFKFNWGKIVLLLEKNNVIELDNFSILVHF